LVEELNEARLFQRSMLAPERAEIEGIQIRAACLPSAELGGDLYDYMPAARGRLALVIADVRGHGASAAFMTATVKAAFRGGGLHGFDPQWIVASLAGSLKALPPDRFVTAFIGLLDADSGWLRYVNAGHPPGVILCDGESPHLLHSTGPLVCSEFEAGSWSAAEVRLTPGARLLLFTDGLTDVSGAAGRYGIPRLVSRAASAAEDGDRLLADLLADVRAFGTDGPQEDDLTAMVVWRL
jgi:sigma-B regulation protein RsbU (phosphoserine phosphatase)